MYNHIQIGVYMSEHSYPYMINISRHIQTYPDISRHMKTICVYVWSGARPCKPRPLRAGWGLLFVGVRLSPCSANLSDPL